MRSFWHVDNGESIWRAWFLVVLRCGGVNARSRGLVIVPVFCLLSSEQLIGFLGFAEPSVVSFAVSVAKSSKTADAAAESIASVCELPVNEDTRRFAAELYARVPRAMAPPSAKAAVC
jgi:hypothetical protein